MHIDVIWGMSVLVAKEIELKVCVVKFHETVISH